MRGTSRSPSRALFDRRRALHVGRHQQRLAATLRQVQRQLGRERRLAGSLQAGNQHDRRRAGELQIGTLAAEQVHQLFVHDLDELLPRLQRAQHVAAQGFLAHARHEVARHGEVHIGFQQRLAHLAQGRRDVLLGHARLAAHSAEHAVQAFGQFLEHQASRWRLVGPSGAQTEAGAVHKRLRLAAPARADKPRRGGIHAGPAACSSWIRAA
jgi:hypothetical protein